MVAWGRNRAVKVEQIDFGNTQRRGNVRQPAAWITLIGFPSLDRSNCGVEYGGELGLCDWGDATATD
jgi:hypothetical protein